MRFTDVVGQDHVTRTLKNAIREGRLAHAYLFTGQRGCGKTTVARILAKAINCPNAAQHDFEPCNACEVCQAITDGRSMDVSEIDGASNNGVDDVRTMRDNVKYPPLQGTYKVIIIDEVHMLSTSAFNALLKTLEEPPRHLVFVFATTEVQKVLPTILSRTQRYDFRRMQLQEIIDRLTLIAKSDAISIDEEALLIIAKKADGSMRDAQSIFDQVIAFCGRNVDTAHVREALNLIDLDFHFDVSDAILARQPAKAFEISHEIMLRGYDVEEFFVGLLEHFRNMLTANLMKSAKLLEVSKLHQERYIGIAEKVTESDVLRLIRLAQHALESLRASQQPRIVLEVALVEMMMMERAIELQSLLSEIRSLGNGLPSPSAKSAPERPVVQEPSREVISRSTPPAPRSVQSISEKLAVKPDSTPVNAESSSSASSLSAELIASRWPDLSAFVKTKNRLISTIMDQTELCGLRRSVLYIGVTTKEALDILRQYRDAFSAILSEFYGQNLTFEAGPGSEMRTKAEVPIVMGGAASTARTKESDAGETGLRSNIELTPMEQALVRELKAQPVD